MDINLNEVVFSVDSTESADDEEPDADVEFRHLDVSEHLVFTSVGLERDTGIDGFDENGVRVNEADGEVASVDVVYDAMEPGAPDERNGVRVTSEFLQTVAEKDYDGVPFMLGHSDQPLDEIGKVQKVWYANQAEKLRVMARVFNTGAKTHDEVISRFTHDPPTMTDGSVGFGDQYEAAMNAADEPELIDGTIREFSTTPFPGGYEDGGLGVSAAFAEAIDEAEFDDVGQGDTTENSAIVSEETLSI